MKCHRILKHLGWSIPALLLLTILLYQSVKRQQTAQADSMELNSPNSQEIPTNYENAPPSQNPIEPINPPVPQESPIPTQTPSHQPLRGKTPKELGADYMPMVRKARETVARLQPTMQIKFPLGVDYPIVINPKTEKEKTNTITPEKREGNFLSQRQLEILGVVDISGKPQPINPNDLLEMFDVHLRGLNPDSLSNAFANKTIPVVDAQGSDTQNQKVLVLDLIVIEPTTEQIYLVPSVAAIAILRDALNAALNDTITQNNYNISQLRLDLNQPDQPIPSAL